jgi:hypothetical protein
VHQGRQDIGQVVIAVIKGDGETHRVAIRKRCIERIESETVVLQE